MLELESRVMKRLSYLFKTEKNRATNKRRMNAKDETQIGDPKALSLRTLHFILWKILYILQVQIRRLKQRIRMPYIPLILRWICHFEKRSSFQKEMDLCNFASEKLSLASYDVSYETAFCSAFYSADSDASV